MKNEHNQLKLLYGYQGVYENVFINADLELDIVERTQHIKDFSIENIFINKEDGKFVDSFVENYTAEHQTYILSTSPANFRKITQAYPYYRLFRWNEEIKSMGSLNDQELKINILKDRITNKPKYSLITSMCKLNG